MSGALPPSDPGSGEPSSGGGEQAEASVLGNLPRTRPAVRSPRRADPDRIAPEQPAAEPEAEAAGEGSAERPADAAELARAGISLAGEAATLGFRIAGRAAAALRDAAQRR